MFQIRSIVCPVDLSDASEYVLDYTINLAAALGASVTVAHIWQPLTYALAQGVGIPVSEDLDHYLGDLNSKLDTLTAPYSLKGVKIDVAIVAGVPYKEIVQLAMERNADMIVMGTHGHTGVAHVLLGSVAERVVRTSPIPVLTVRQPLAKENVQEQELPGTKLFV